MSLNGDLEAVRNAVDAALGSLEANRARIDDLVKQSGLSARHFQRRFTSQVGLSPKLYARTIRFDTALTAHRNEPTKPWTKIVHEAGYFDQAHLARDFGDRGSPRIGAVRTHPAQLYHRAYGQRKRRQFHGR